MVVVRSRTIVVSIPWGIDGLQEGQLVADALVGLDDVGARLAEDDDAMTEGLAVEIAGGADVLDRSR